MTNSSFWVGVFSLAHITLAGLGVGFMILAPIAEGLGRTRPHFTDFAYSATRFTLVTYTTSIVLAVFMLELFIGLFPLTNSWLFNHFRSPLHLALAAFFIQVFCLYPYYHFWNRLRSKSITGHMTLGASAAVLILIWGGILDGIGSFMMTPVEGETGWARLWNPTWVPLLVHRFFGNLVIAGYVMAAYAGWRLWNPSLQPNHVEYYLTLLKTGMAIGIVSLMIQPVSGFIFAQQIQHAQPDVQQFLYNGPTILLVYGQFTLLALLLLGSHLIFCPGHFDRNHSHWAEFLYVLSIILMVILAPYPFYRRIVTVIVLLQTGWHLTVVFPVWLRDATPTLNKPFTRSIAMTLGFAALLLYLTMGTIREMARGNDTINGIIERQMESAFIAETFP
ncbi:MAG: cytochrome ubiquinol oxidase subunit I [Nitrospirales bacterium]|nr:cytochrome ubiquinol oxidase subunit I [Nitrospirales bacterium]